MDTPTPSPTTAEETVPAAEVVQVKFFQLGALECGCGSPVACVRIALTASSRMLVAAVCNECAADSAAELTAAGFHVDRGEGLSMFNEQFVPGRTGR